MGALAPVFPFKSWHALCLVGTFHALILDNVLSGLTTDYPKKGGLPPATRFFQKPKAVLRGETRGLSSRDAVAGCVTI